MSNVVTTARQEREWGGGASNWYNTLKGRQSKAALWRLKRHNPSLFGKTKEEVEGPKEVIAPPLGFKPCDLHGWYHHPERRVYLEKTTGRRCWLDETTGKLEDFNEGETWGVVFKGGAAALGTSSSSNATAKKPSSKHVIVADLHRAAEVLRIDLSHVDKPSSMMAVFAPVMSNTSFETHVLNAARSLHEKLLKALGHFRGEWTGEALCACFASAVTDVSHSTTGSQLVYVAAVLSIGHRVVTAATAGARFLISPQPKPNLPQSDTMASSEGNHSIAMAAPKDSEQTLSAFRELDEEVAEHLHVVLIAGPAASKEETAKATLEAAPVLSKGRPRATCLALLHAASAAPGQPLVAACGILTAANEEVVSAPPAKKQKTESAKVRIRQILIRHSSTIAHAVDPVRRKPVKRSLEEAEKQILTFLQQVETEGDSVFPHLCRTFSESPSALKGGDMAGDEGWLDQAMLTALQQAKTKTGRQELPIIVMKTALELSVGQISDVVSSDVGAHLLQRTA